METWYHGDRSTPIYVSFRSQPYTAPMRRGSLQALTGVGGVSSRTSVIHFWALHARSCLLIYTLPWCKHGTMAIGPPQFMQVSILGPILLQMRWGSLSACTGKWGFCTNEWNTFVGSPSPYLPFDLDIALVETRYDGDRSSPIYASFHSRPSTALNETGQFAGPHR